MSKWLGYTVELFSNGQWFNIDQWHRHANGELRHRYLYTAPERDIFSSAHDELALSKERICFSDLAAETQDMASRRKKPRCSSSNTVPTQRHRIMRLHFSKGGKRNRKRKRGIAPMLSKEGFCKALQKIKEQESIDEQFSKALDLVGNGHFVFGAENKYLLALRDVLKEAVNDQYDYIDWWLYEATDDYTVWEADCTMKYCLKEPEALYDFITGTLKPVPVSSGESTSQQE